MAFFLCEISSEMKNYFIVLLFTSEGNLDTVLGCAHVRQSTAFLWTLKLRKLRKRVFFTNHY